MHYLGIEIGGTKLQVGVGPDDGRLRGLWRGKVDLAAGPAGIRRQIVEAVPAALAEAGLTKNQVCGVGIGFGGPVDDTTRTVIKSHQIEGWDGFPLADWISDAIDLPAVLGNDGDVAGLGEATHGAGKGLSPIFYITVGTGIGGGLVIDGKIYRGIGRGAAEIGHLRVPSMDLQETPLVELLEEVASGPAIEERAEVCVRGRPESALARLAGEDDPVTARHVAVAIREGDPHALFAMRLAIEPLAEAICSVIALLCPRRIVIGGGVSLMGEKVFFRPLRRHVKKLVFRPFAGLTDIVPAALGEEVVVHGAIRLARQKLGEQGG